MGLCGNLLLNTPGLLWITWYIPSFWAYGTTDTCTSTPERLKTAACKLKALKSFTLSVRLMQTNLILCSQAETIVSYSKLLLSSSNYEINYRFKYNLLLVPFKHALNSFQQWKCLLWLNYAMATSFFFHNFQGEYAPIPSLRMVMPVKLTQTWVQTDSNLGMNWLKFGHKSTQIWVRIDCIWVRNDRKLRKAAKLWKQGMYGVKKLLEVTTPKTGHLREISNAKSEI